MKKVIIGSVNPVKVESVADGFKKMFPEQAFVFSGINAPSEVSDQPLGNTETYTGALNRAKNAKGLKPEADYWVGVEGGNISFENGEMEAMAWIVVIDKNNKIGKARTAGFYLPQKTVALIEQGYELGHADEIVFQVKNSKQKMGSTGLLTNNALNRYEFYVQAVILALIPFLKSDLY